MQTLNTITIKYMDTEHTSQKAHRYIFVSKQKL